MPFKYHPPTRDSCEICQKYNGDLHPIINTSKGKASSADNFSFHNWYNFVLGYSPEFPDYLIAREDIKKTHFVVDPFLGSGTTMICCKSKGIPSGGVEANDFFKFASETKLEWNLDIKTLEKEKDKILQQVGKQLSEYKWPSNSSQEELPFEKKGNLDPNKYAQTNRPKLLLEKYISNVPFTKLDLIKKCLLNHNWVDDKMKKFFFLAYAATVLPVSNVRYGPGFGIIKPKVNIDVLTEFKKRLNRMLSDIKDISNEKRRIESNVYLGDARQLSSYFKANSVDFMITSPPYPGDHEYTKHSKLELIFSDFALSLEDFRKIKQRMLRGSTTNIYKIDKEGDLVKNIKSIEKITKEIDNRLKNDGATSGFEKLYVKLIWEYFGGMYKVFKEVFKILKPSGKFSLLVSDSHAFKMVHIETAELLREVAEKAGFKISHIELWQYKNSTSHKYKLLENILTVQKND